MDDGTFLVRVSRELFTVLEHGQPSSPVVLVGITTLEDGTHDMVFRAWEPPTTLDRTPRPRRFHVQATPSFDSFQTVTLSVHAGQDGDVGGCVSETHQDVTVEDARAYAAEIVYWCDVVDKDRERPWTSP